MTKKMHKNLHIFTKSSTFVANLQNTYIMKRHFLPLGIGIAMTKSQFCFATGCTPYRLKQIIAEKAAKYQRLGLSKYDKMLMPIVVQELLADTHLRIDMGFYIQYIQGQKGNVSEVETIDTDQ